MKHEMNTENTNEGKYKIRPSARLIKTIGKDLVKDRFAAVVELVKNAFDADSPSAEVQLSYLKDINELTISVADQGHGMDINAVEKKWLVPATSDKLKRKTSEGGRQLQGRKGIGRFAAAALGDAIFLTTKANKKNEVSLLLDLEDFSDEKYLEDIDILLEETKTNSDTGTKIEIITKDFSFEDLKENWGKKQREKLLAELRKLLAPVETSTTAKKLGYNSTIESFSVSIKFKGFPDVSEERIEIKPYNIIELFDYRIHGHIDENGKGSIEYFNQNIPDLQKEKINIQLHLENKTEQNYPGKISFDLRVFDRDPESIEELINRGLKDPLSGDKISKKQAKNILDEYYGISLFRGEFRVRPYGDRDFDWLELDKERVQNPSMRIGHNQVIGFVNIQPEELSNLEEKSARDGLVENKYYEGLKFLVLAIMRLLESRRFGFREKAFRGRKPRMLDEKIDDLFDFRGVTKRLRKKISKLAFPGQQEEFLLTIIDDEFESEKRKKANDLKKIRDTVALYQGQATLGKITHVVLHEGRKHIKVINEVPSNLVKWVKALSEKFDSEKHSRLMDRSELLSTSAKSLAQLFKRIEPLAISRRPNRKYLALAREIKSCFSVFEDDFNKDGIAINIDIPQDMEIFSTTFDIMTIFANLIENSLYWLRLSDKTEKNITVEADKTTGGLEIIYSDSGVGFQGSNLELMFEPGYSMKPEGTGLGLALAGEGANRMNGVIRAVESKNGACFVIELK